MSVKTKAAVRKTAIRNGKCGTCLGEMIEQVTSAGTWLPHEGECGPCRFRKFSNPRVNDPTE